MKTLGGIFLGLFLLAGGLYVIAVTGSYNVAATSSAGKFERKAAGFVLDHSIAKRAAVRKNPFSGTPENLRTGLRHFKENCVVCHGAPGVPETEFGMGLNPSAPDLTLPAIQSMSDGEVFWVVSNGIRMTGMPAFSLTHSAEEIWKIVAFVRHLPALTEDEVKALKAGSDESDHHHEGPVSEEGEKSIEKTPAPAPDSSAPPAAATPRR